MNNVKSFVFKYIAVIIVTMIITAGVTFLFLASLGDTRCGKGRATSALQSTRSVIPNLIVCLDGGGKSLPPASPVGKGPFCNNSALTSGQWPYLGDDWTYDMSSFTFTDTDFIFSASDPNSEKYITCTSDGCTMFDPERD